MSQEKLHELEAQIQKIKQALMEIGEMRPGSLTRQYQRPKEAKNPYYQLSYTYRMKSRTNYIRSPFVRRIRQQIQEYKRFKALVARWVDYAIRHSQQSMGILKNRS